MNETANDSILISEMEISTRIGVPDDERREAQRLTVSIGMWPLAGFGDMQDEIARTVNYAAVADDVRAFCSSREDRLIETLADALATHLLDSYRLKRVRVELRKFVLPETKFVAAICERSG